ncbi:RNA polymerase sigma factor [compost metagenome]
MSELERLSDAIADLPPRCQMVFVMHKIHELSQAEVAERMGISLKAVEKHLRLGMAACRARLGYEVSRP